VKKTVTVSSDTPSGTYTGQRAIPRRCVRPARRCCQDSTATVTVQASPTTPTSWRCVTGLHMAFPSDPYDHCRRRA
jgi:hypothetical protein